MKITHPWVIIHQENGVGPMHTILAGPESATMSQFALLAADLIRHIALSSGHTESEVTDLVMKEIGKPTTDVKRITNA